MRGMWRVVVPVLAIGLTGFVIWQTGSPKATTQGAAPELELRLVADREAYAAGDLVTIQLELANRSDKPYSYQTPQDFLRESGLTVTRDGEPVRYVAGFFQTLGTNKTLAAGERKVISTIRLSEFWDTRRPGHYSVSYGGSDGGVPMSSVLEFDVELPPGGKIPPPDLRDRVKIAGREARFGDYWKWQGAALNYRPPPLGDTAEAIGAVLGMVWPDTPTTLYDGREIVVLAPVGSGRESDVFDVRTAELDGNTIRLVLDHLAEDEGPGLIHFLKVDLERLLGPGDYTCTLEVARRPHDSAVIPKDTRREFTFTVQTGPPAATPH